MDPPWFGKKKLKSLEETGAADLLLLVQSELVVGSDEIARLDLDRVRSKNAVLLRDDLPICHYRVLRSRLRHHFHFISTRCHSGATEMGVSGFPGSLAPS